MKTYLVTLIIVLYSSLAVGQIPTTTLVLTTEQKEAIIKFAESDIWSEVDSFIDVERFLKKFAEDEKLTEDDVKVIKEFMRTQSSPIYKSRDVRVQLIMEKLLTNSGKRRWENLENWERIVFNNLLADCLKYKIVKGTRRSDLGSLTLLFINKPIVAYKPKSKKRPPRKPTRKCRDGKCEPLPDPIPIVYPEWAKAEAPKAEAPKAEDPKAEDPKGEDTKKDPT